MDKNKLQKIAKLIRYYILASTTKAGSGHLTSSLSATDLMVGLMFGWMFRFDLEDPKYLNNDRLIFSKGHASPLFYALWAVARNSPSTFSLIREGELKNFRRFTSRLEGHPTLQFPYTEAATGSLGQGLSIGLGMALNAKLEKLPYKTYVLMGDSEVAEGSVWEAMEIATYYKLNNLVGIIDVNRLGQRGETLHGYDMKVYENKAKAFGWETVVIDGHDMGEILKAFNKATPTTLAAKTAIPPCAEGDKPMMIIAKTLKGKGVSFLEDKDGWHGKVLNQEQFKDAVEELGEIDKSIRGTIVKPEKIQISKSKLKIKSKFQNPNYKLGDNVATRKAYGDALVKIAEADHRVVALDAETSNSTCSETLKKFAPERFFEMFIAEQNMVGTALGLSRRGKIPFVSTFAAFFTRAFDQIRMSQYSNANIKFVGSHAGVSIGEDGASQMALEDISMFRAVHGSTVLYPSDAVSAEKLTAAAAEHKGNVFIRTTRSATPVVYKSTEKFKIGGSKVLKKSSKDKVTVIGAGITLHEALKAYDELRKKNINIRVIDLYSVKPIDVETIKKAAQETKAIITVEDHYHEGGIGEAVLYCLAELVKVQVPVYILAVRKIARSGKPEELLRYEEIDSTAIVKKVLALRNTN
ncbi:MAG: transketolase [Candidatus Doudnabacteria bacterium CG10_big_fil_rev_8_21_14_0_10_41_10]|uniref:Transketolase n=1 Tax=Candidatus Doudnabacteria bacterium CG10_big_fil_rev_8_21_14_0_10_41_10 TaxID=1974551 RepID=A0A2H0VF66_9BACT|nr:MAG: transketolase [Candidatus Doudnabacteria bacterium CG10_big_fil_rev_8_21_14_0_10_41_10]